MITFHLKSSVAITVLSFLAGCCIAFLLTSDCGQSGHKAQLITIEKLKKDVQDKEHYYQDKISELHRKNASLQQELSSAQVELFSLSLKAKQKEAAIKKMVEPRIRPGLSAKQFIRKVNGQTFSVDSSLSPCDSLAVAVMEYIGDNTAKDSLYKKQITLQDSIIQVKSVEITIRDSLHREIKTSLAVSLAQQQLLADQNSLLQKQLKRQKRRSRLLSIGGIILTGFATNYFLNH